MELKILIPVTYIIISYITVLIWIYSTFKEAKQEKDKGLIDETTEKLLLYGSIIFFIFSPISLIYIIIMTIKNLIK